MHLIKHRGKVVGKATFEQIEVLVQRGQITPYHKISSDGGQTWTYASDIPELFETVPAAPSHVEPPPRDHAPPLAAENGNCPACGVAIDAHATVCPNCQFDKSGAPRISLAAADATTSRTAKSPSRMLLCYAIGMGAAYLFLIAWVACIAVEEESGTVSFIPFSLFYVSALSQMVFFCIWLYQAWTTLPAAYQNRVTPASAIGFLFVPFYNLYWVFVAIPGLASRLSQCLGDHDRESAGTTGYELGVAACVAAFMPCLNVLACPVLLLVFMLQVDAARRRIEGGSPEPSYAYQ